MGLSPLPQSSINYNINEKFTVRKTLVLGDDKIEDKPQTIIQNHVRVSHDRRYLQTV